MKHESSLGTHGQSHFSNTVLSLPKGLLSICSTRNKLVLGISLSSVNLCMCTSLDMKPQRKGKVSGRIQGYPHPIYSLKGKIKVHIRGWLYFSGAPFTHNGDQSYNNSTFCIVRSEYDLV